MVQSWIFGLVTGVASFLIYQFGGTPLGKVFLGYLGGALGLAGGLWLERKEKYRGFARSLMGGGWALLYFTTYAMHHVAAARVIELAEQNPAPSRASVGADAEEILRVVREKSDAEQDAIRLQLVGLS